MRRVSVFLTTLVLAALLLAACGGQETSTSVPNTSLPPVTVESTSTTEMTATEAPTSAPEMTTTPVVPVTGENSPSRVSNLIGSSVCGMSGDTLGTVQDLVVDFDQTMVTYVIVEASGRSVAVPWTSFDLSSLGGTGTGTGTGTGLETSTPESSTGTGLETSTPELSTGTGLETSTPEAGATAEATATSEASTGTGTSVQNCLALTVDDDTFNNAPDFDASTLPLQGQSATGWDTSMSDYWANPTAGGTGGTGAVSTDTPSAGGTNATAVPSTTAAAGTGAGNSTATSSTGSIGTGTGTEMGQGAMQMQGVMLATDILGTTVTVSSPGTATGTGLETSTPELSTGTGLETNTPEAGATAEATATSEASTGTGTGTGDFSSGTVEDMIIEPMTGTLQYVVVSFGSDSWVPIPVSMLNWDSTMSGFVLNVSADVLQNAPAFSSDQFPDTSMSGWDQEFSTYWQSNSGTGSGTGTGGVSVSTATATP